MVAESTIVSVDLAYRDYGDIGVVALRAGRCGATYELLDLRPSLAVTPCPDAVAHALAEACARLGVTLLMIDGPQAWKGAQNGLLHSRVCERMLNAPGKTGLPGTAKPASYLPFIAFSISVFDALNALGWRRHDPGTWQPWQRTVVETLPLSAWRSLQLPSLPAKRNAKPHVVDACRQRLVGAGLITDHGERTTHDQLQAIVAGLAGLAMMSGSTGSYIAHGTAPFIEGDTYREGYIVNPTGIPAPL